MFDAKKLDVYAGKNRVYESYSVGVERIWIWDKKKERYVKPDKGGHYRVRKTIDGKRRTCYFKTFSDARKFQTGQIEVNGSQYSGPKLYEVWQLYRESDAWSLNLSESTRNTYRRAFERFWFDFIRDVPIRKLTHTKLDDWIDWMGVNKDHYGSSKQNFKKELDLLKSVLKFYHDYIDDDEFKDPIKPRHFTKIYFWVDETDDRREGASEIPLDEDEFTRFLAALNQGPNGRIMPMLAQLQYHHALRICEAIAVKGSDFDWKKRIVEFKRHRLFLRGHGEADKTVDGLKNRQSKLFRERGSKHRNVNSKVHKIFPQYMTHLQKFYLSLEDKSGYLFLTDEGDLPSYKQIQYAYDRAFKLADLSYRGTHILRKAGNTSVFDKTQCKKTSLELLGNDTVLDPYILSRSKRLDKFIDPLWEADERAREALDQIEKSL